MTGIGQELVQHIPGFELEAAGTDTGVAAQVFCLVDLPFHQKADPVIGVVH